MWTAILCKVNSLRSSEMVILHNFARRLKGVVTLVSSAEPDFQWFFLFRQTLAYKIYCFKVHLCIDLCQPLPDFFLLDATVLGCDARLYPLSSLSWRNSVSSWRLNCIQNARLKSDPATGLSAKLVAARPRYDPVAYSVDLVYEPFY
jgi:hypothetical protein